MDHSPLLRCLRWVIQSTVSKLLTLMVRSFCFPLGSGQGGGAGGGGFSFDAFAKSVTQAHGGQLPAVSPPSPTSSSSVESNSQAQSEVLRPQKPHTVPSNFQPAPARSVRDTALLAYESPHMTFRGTGGSLCSSNGLVRCIWRAQRWRRKGFSSAIPFIHQRKCRSPSTAI